MEFRDLLVSVPIWGLFNLTRGKLLAISEITTNEFPSPSGDHLI